MRELNHNDVNAINGAGSWSHFTAGVSKALSSVSTALESTATEISTSSNPGLIFKAFGLNIAQAHLTFLSGLSGTAGTNTTDSAAS